jgi:glycosyltransferase involved in cell wall biosynthesis
MYRIKDPTLIKEIPSSAKVYRTFSFEHIVLRAPRLLKINLKWFYIPDENIGWLPFGVFTGTRLVKKAKIDVIYATSPTWTSLLIGFLLKRKTKKPLVLDFRDPWTNNYLARYPTEFHKNLERTMEKTVLTQADYVTVATDLMKDALLKNYPFLKSKIETITNGFDSEDFEDLKIRKTTGKFSITYVGSIYGSITAEPFLVALKELVDEKKECRENIEVLFVGSYGKETPHLVRKLGLEKNVRFIEYVSHREGLEFMVNSQVLLLLITIEESKGKAILTGKLFEYLASRKPIIAIAPEDGLAAAVINSSNSGAAVSPRNVPRIKTTIFEFYQQWSTGKLSATTDLESIEMYNRKFLTRKLAQIFEKLTQ